MHVLMRNGRRSLRRAMDQQEPWRTIRQWRRSRQRYRQAFAEWPRVIRPWTFNEWVIRRMLFEHEPRLRRCVDKLAVRDYVRERVGGQVLPEVLLVGERAEAYDAAAWPVPVMVKATHGSGWQLLPQQQQELGTAGVRAVIARWLAQDYGAVSGEWAYRGVPRRFMLEEWLGDSAGATPDDFKFYCFGGRVALVQIDAGRFTQHTRAFYDRDWQFRPVTMRGEPVTPGAAQRPRPVGWSTLVQTAEALAQGWDFLRVDLYDHPRGVIFGELTVYPNSGVAPFTPAAIDRELGVLWTAARRS
jgi:hypothetical protein